MKTSNKKIILIGTTASSILGFRKDFIRLLLTKNYTVYTVVSEYSDSELMQIKAMGVLPITYQMNRGGLNPFMDIFSCYQLYRKIDKINPDIVFSFFSKPVIYGTIAAKLVGVPKVIGMLEGLGYTFTEQPEGISRTTKTIQKIQLILYKLSLPFLDQLVFLNQDDIEDLVKKHKIHVANVHILGGIGLNFLEYPYSKAPIKNIKFIFVGRLLKEKGIYDFVSACKSVKKKYPRTEFIIVGGLDPQNPGALSRQQLDQLITENLVTYAGYTSDVQSWIAKSSVFVLPSYREGLPRSTQEAMAIGRPVITTDVPGCRDTVIDGVTGFLVARWSPQELAEKMIYFIENPEKINQMGLEGYKLAQQKFDANSVNQRLLNIIER